MDSCEFRKRGKEMVDYIADYMETLSVRKVTAQVEPGKMIGLPKDFLHESGKGGGVIQVCATLGTTAVCSFDALHEIAEFAHSINFNPNKWMLHWGIPLSRRFRSLKLWFVLRTYGIEGLQHYIREHVRLAKLFESKVLEEDRFEVLGQVIMGLVCFRLKGPNTLTQKLLRQINESGRLHMVPALLNEHYIIRFAICAQNADDSDIIYAWQTISKIADELLASRERESSVRESRRIALSDTSEEGESAEEEEVFLEFDKENIYDNQQLNFQRARMRRNLFLRMVSDPKSYSPHMMKSYSIDDSSSRLPSDTPSETGSTNSTKRSPKTPQLATPL
uniref:Tryptophan decarboxylase n=1 Tax=Callistoctopus minor TaxID=515824 RepID=A0AAU7P2T5_CALMC